MSNNREIPLAVTVGKNIVSLRKRLGLSQKELAARLNITQEAMGRMERGTLGPKMGRLQDIADNLHCSVAYLFNVENEELENNATIIAHIINPLSQKRQAAIIDLVARTVDMALIQE